jgi:hypothetical protein
VTVFHEPLPDLDDLVHGNEDLIASFAGKSRA